MLLNIHIDPYVFFISLIVGIITEALVNDTSAVRRLFRSFEFITYSGLVAWAVPNVSHMVASSTGVSHDAAVFLVVMICLKGTRYATIRATPKIEARLAKQVGRALLKLEDRGEPPTNRNIIREVLSTFLNREGNGEAR